VATISTILSKFHRNGRAAAMPNFSLAWPLWRPPYTASGATAHTRLSNTTECDRRSTHRHSFS